MALTLCVGAISLSACSGSAGTGPPNPPGNYITLDQHCYPLFNNYLLNNADVPELHNKLVSLNWSRIEAIEDDPSCNGPEPAVHASMFGDSTAKQADFIWFSGHGDQGIVSLYSYDPSISGPNCFQNNPDATCFWGGSAVNPTSGRLKWIFAFASVDTADNHWTYAFNTNTSGLHGYYGVEGEPSALDSYAITMADTFVDQATGSGNNGGQSIHSAWHHAVDTLSVSVGEWELKDAMGDKLSSNAQSSGIYTTSNPVVYTNSNGQTLYPLSINSLSTASPGQYRPIALTTESYSDSTLTSQAGARDSATVGSYASGNQYRLVGQNFTGSHYEGSQGIVASAEDTKLPYNFAQQDALNFAIQTAQQNNPIPSDAQLQYVTPVYQTQSGQAPVLIGYEFTWIHNNLTLGGDFIRIGVDNVKNRVCEQVNENDPPHNHPACLQWGYEYDQHVNFYYRLWREPNGSVRYPQGITPGSAALSSSQAFNLASAQLAKKGANLGNLLGYVYSYWTPAITSTDNTAYPAYHFFYDSHNVVSVDAYAGTVQGINAYVQ